MDDFRATCAQFIGASQQRGSACPEFGSIMPPAMFEQARAWQRYMFEQGFAGIHWPVEHGGRGLSGEHSLVWAQECARAGVAPYMNFQGIALTGPAIIKYGTEAQKTRFLERTLSAEIVWCQLFSEPGSGSDLASLSTRAQTTGAGWLATGQKVWSSTAQLAQFGILMARTNPDEPAHRGISFFLFDMSSLGVDVRPIKQMTGDSEFCEVFLEEAPISADDLLGPLHGGWTVAASVLADERSSVGTASFGLNRRLNALGASTDQNRLLDLHARGAALTHLLGRTAGNPLLGPLSKLGMTEMSSALSRYAIDAQGADGMLINNHTESFLYAPGMRVAGGTSEIQRNLIGERLLGLPREPRP